MVSSIGIENARPWNDGPNFWNLFGQQFYCCETKFLFFWEKHPKTEKLYNQYLKKKPVFMKSPDWEICFSKFMHFHIAQKITQYSTIEYLILCRGKFWSRTCWKCVDFGNIQSSKGLYFLDETKILFSCFCNSIFSISLLKKREIRLLRSIFFIFFVYPLYSRNFSEKTGMWFRFIFWGTKLKDPDKKRGIFSFSRTLSAGRYFKKLFKKQTPKFRFFAFFSFV